MTATFGFGELVERLHRFERAYDVRISLQASAFTEHEALQVHMTRGNKHNVRTISTAEFVHTVVPPLKLLDFHLERMLEGFMPRKEITP